MNTPEQTEMISQIKRLAELSVEIDALWLYGSMVDGTSHEDSDFDIAVAFTDFIAAPLERSLRPEKLAMEWASTLKLAQSMLSIVDINNIPSPLAWEIVSKGSLLVEKGNGRAYWEFDRISREYEIDVLYHRKQYG